MRFFAEHTSFTTSASGENAWGNNQGADVPMHPNISPVNAPIITRVFNNIRACLAIRLQTKSMQIDILEVVNFLSTRKNNSTLTKSINFLQEEN